MGGEYIIDAYLDWYFSEEESEEENGTDEENIWKNKTKKTGKVSEDEFRDTLCNSTSGI